MLSPKALEEVVNTTQHTAPAGQSHFQPLTPGVGVYLRLYLPIVLGLMSVSADDSRMVATQKRRRRRKATDRQGKSTNALYFAGEQCQLWAVQVGCTVCVYIVKNQPCYSPLTEQLWCFLFIRGTDDT